MRMIFVRKFVGIVSFGLAALFGSLAYCWIALSLSLPIQWTPWGSSTSSLQILGITFSGWQIHLVSVCLVAITVACLIGGVYAFRSRKFPT
jgi:hypothetical protein